MCGLVGVFSKRLSVPERVAFKWLLHLDVIRGPHSTGILAVHDKGQTEVFKALGSPDYLYDKYLNDFTDEGVYNYWDCSLLLGHNRFATQGEINEENAHPFEFSNVIGAHNGTINQWELKKFHGYGEFKIDSQILYYEINKNNDLQFVWDEVYSGAIALTWWNKEESSLNFVRNDDRPLHYCYTNTGTLFWASKPWMLQVALAQAGIKYTKISDLPVNLHKQFTIVGDKIEEVENKLEPSKFSGNFRGTGWLPPKQENKVVRFVLEEFHSHGVTADGARIGMFVGKTVEGEDVAVHINDSITKYYDFIKSHSDWEVDASDSYIFNNIRYITAGKIRRPLQDVELRKSNFILDNEGVLIFKEDYEKMNCDCCGSRLDWDKREESKIIAQDIAICHDCVDNPLVKEYIQELSE